MAGRIQVTAYHYTIGSDLQCVVFYLNISTTKTTEMTPICLSSHLLIPGYFFNTGSFFNELNTGTPTNVHFSSLSTANHKSDTSTPHTTPSPINWMHPTPSNPPTTQSIYTFSAPSHFTPRPFHPQMHHSVVAPFVYIQPTKHFQQPE